MRFEIYRSAWTALLTRYRGRQGGDVGYFVEELKESFLDLKEATIADDPVRTAQAADEIMLLLTELERHSQGE